MNKTAVISNFLCLFLFLFEKISLLDPDLHIECGSGSTALIYKKHEISSQKGAFVYFEPF